MDRLSFVPGEPKRYPAEVTLDKSLLTLSYPNDEPDEVIVELVAQLVGKQLSLAEYRKVHEHLSGEDYTIAERFFPALENLVQLVNDQENASTRNSMAVTLAVSMRYAVCNDFDPTEFDATTQAKIQDCCRLFVEHYIQTDDVENQRYLLTGIAACKGDISATTVMHDLASGNTGEYSSIRIE